MSKIVVMGGSHGIGLETVKILLKQGHHVTLFSREATKVNLSNPNLHLLAGDALNEGDVNAAIEAKDAVVQTLGVPLNLRLIVGPINFFSSATRLTAPLTSGLISKILSRSIPDRLINFPL